MNQDKAVLLVEDNKLDRLFFTRAYQRSGFSNPLRNVQTEQEAQSYLRGDREFADRLKYPFPRVVVLDLTLPDKNGLELVRWMRSHPETNSVGVVILGGTGNPVEQEEATGLGVDGYHEKPNSLDGLNDLVQEIMRRWLAKEEHVTDN
jgi:DNA-binding response OmpR family regulator